MSELATHYQLDVRELDCQKLGTFANTDYYEVRQILRVSGEERAIVGRASDWPIVSRDARIAELEQRITELEQQIKEAPAVAAAAVGLPLDTPPATPDDGLIACDWPGCEDRVKPRGLGAHKKHAHGIAGTVGHKPSRAIAPPEHVLDALTLPEPPWRCAQCESSTHARSLSDPARCMRCAADRVVTNGHLAAA